MIREVQVTVTTAGTAGSATGTGLSDTINGQLLAAHINYHASAPGTTTVDLDEVGGPGRKLLDKAGSNTDITHYPRVQMEGTTGSGLTGIYEPFALAGRKVQVSVAASDALTGAVVVTLIVEE